MKSLKITRKRFYRLILAAVLSALFSPILSHAVAADSMRPIESGPVAKKEGKFDDRSAGSRLTLEDRLNEMRKHVATRAEAAERLRQFNNLVQSNLQKIEAGDHEAAGQLTHTLELLPEDENSNDDPVFRQYREDLMGRLPPPPPEVRSRVSKFYASEEPSAIRRFRRYFTGPGKPWLDTGLRRLSNYREMVEKTLSAEGMPLELMYLPIIESLYDPKAVSNAGAKGLWQFVPETAKRFGLRQTASIDEREHPEKSTRAAARYLRSLYAQFGDWPLALAAYNAGENRIQRVMRQTGVQSFWRLAAKNLVPRETQNYVLAALAIIGLMQESPKTKNFFDWDDQKSGVSAKPSPTGPGIVQ